MAYRNFLGLHNENHQAAVWVYALCSWFHMPQTDALQVKAPSFWQRYWVVPVTAELERIMVGIRTCSSDTCRWLKCNPSLLTKCLPVCAFQGFSQRAVMFSSGDCSIVGMDVTDQILRTLKAGIVAFYFRDACFWARCLVSFLFSSSPPNLRIPQSSSCIRLAATALIASKRPHTSHSLLPWPVTEKEHKGGMCCLTN